MKVRPSERTLLKSKNDLNKMIQTQNFEYIGNVCWDLNEMKLFHNDCSDNELARLLLNRIEELLK